MSYMPTRSDPSAPKFDGKARSLRQFLQEIDLLGQSYSLADAEKIVYTLHYIEPEEGDLWEYLPAVEARDWREFKRQVLELYPERIQTYTIDDLASLVGSQSQTSVRSYSDFGEYYRAFLLVAYNLAEKNVINMEEGAGMYFIQGLQPAFRKLVKEQLQRMFPSHQLHLPWKVEDIYHAVLIMLGSDEGREMSMQKQPEEDLVLQDLTLLRDARNKANDENQIVACGQSISG